MIFCQKVSSLFISIVLLATNNYALQFTRKGTSDYAIKHGMPSLKAVTVCLWMKSSDKGNKGVPLSYAVSGADNELLLFDYKKFYFGVGKNGSYQCPIIG